MYTFKNAIGNESISHDAIKEAAGVPEFIPQFVPVNGDYLFITDNEALAAALDALINAGNLPSVTNVTPASEPQPAKKVKAATDAPNS